MPEFTWPLVTIGIITFNRYEEIIRTVESLARYISYPNLRWVVSDDCTPGNYLQRLRRVQLFKELNVEFITTETNGGWGKNANNLLQVAFSQSDLILQQEDDYELTKPIDLRLGVALLLEKPHLGLLRYRGTAGDHLIFHQFQADITKYIPDWREVRGNAGVLTYLQLDGHSPTAYLYSNGPHLKSRSLHHYYGNYSVGRKLGETEEAFCVQVKTMMNADPAHAPGIAIFPQHIPMIYEHFGKSMQLTEVDQ